MITVLPVKDKKQVQSEFSSHGFTFDENSFCCVAECDGETLGKCLFSIKGDRVTILSVEPADDIMLFDGILRSALHVAAQRFIFVADYLDENLTPTFERLGFIKDKDKKLLDMDKLFGGCGCKK